MRCGLLAPLLVAAGVTAFVSANAAEIFNGTPDIAVETDPSVRSAGMGSASTAVFWGIDPNHWANPALLGYTRGIRYEQGDYDFLFRFRSRRTTLGGGGLGVSLVGQPFTHTGTVEYGWSLDFDGERSEFLDRARSWAIGASLDRLAETVSRVSGHGIPSFTRYADVAVGFAEKRIEHIVSGGYSLPGEPPPVFEERAVTRDWGLLLQVGIPLRFGSFGAGRLEGAYGYADLNYTYTAERDWRNGVAIHMTVDPSRHWIPGLPAWFARGLEPMFSIAAAYDADHSALYTDVDHWGAELGIANALFGRLGQRRNQYGHINHWGVGLGLPLGGYGGARYDHSSQTTLIEDLTRDSWTVWMDPVAVARLRK